MLSMLPKLVTFRYFFALYAPTSNSKANSRRKNQAGVKFAAEHNLRVAVKASGHDYLGRSTAQGSLLLWTRNLRNISFSDSFVLNGTDLGSVMTIGSGNPLNRLYEASGQVGKVFVGGFSATVVAAGGYIQGAGHSPFSPTLGLGADNTLGKKFKIPVRAILNLL